MAPITARRQPSAGSQAALAPLRPQAVQKNLHVCVLNPAGLMPRQGAFTNPQVDDLQGFGLLPLAELKRKHASFLRAGRSETHAIYPHGRGYRCRALRFQASVVSSPLHVVPAALSLSAPGTRSSQPQSQVYAALSLSPRCLPPSPSIPGACGPRPQSQAFAALSLSLSPKHPQHPAHAMHLGAAPSAQSQAPSVSMPPCASRPPFATHHITLHMWFPAQLCTIQASSAQPQPTTPGCLRLTARHGPVPAPLAPRAAARPLPLRRDLFEQPGA